MNILVTGGAGFIGSHFIRHWLANHQDDHVINLDALTYAGNLSNLEDVTKQYVDRYTFVRCDIADSEKVLDIFKKHKPDVVVNFAAESHNSYAITNPRQFFKTNVLGTQSLLDASRIVPIKRFHHVSTCEVYGDLALDSEKQFTETSPLLPRTPYNASKAAADHLVQAYFYTYNTPTVISRCANNYGSHQMPEKLIPRFVSMALKKQPLTLYQSSLNKREWLHVTDHCKAIETMITKAENGSVYNVGSGIEKSVEDITALIVGQLGLTDKDKTYVKDRPSHDKRYLLDSSKLRKELGWKPEIAFEEGINKTIQWYIDNTNWWREAEKKILVEETSW